MQNVPTFPEFRKFSLTDREWYDGFYKRFAPCADFSFGNLAVWLDYHDDLMIANHNNNVIFVCTTLFMNDEKIFTLLGRDELAQTLDAIFAYQQASGQEQVISGLTEAVARNPQLQSSGYDITEDRDNYEYLYKVERWATLEGSLMRKLRREVTTFKNKFGDISSLQDIDLNDTDQVSNMQSCLSRWGQTYSDNDEEQDEAKILNRLFSRANQLPHKCVGLFINNSLEAFLIYQPLPQQSTVLFNHVKASYKYRYMFDFLLHSAAERVAEQGVSEINFEQDLGIAGLREHKESLKPYDFIKKFTVRPKVS